MDEFSSEVRRVGTPYGNRHILREDISCHVFILFSLSSCLAHALEAKETSKVD